MFRNLRETEITLLKQQGCSAENWSQIQVSELFSAGQVSNTQFAGTVKLGINKEYIELENGIEKPSGIRNSFIKNCTIGDNVLISNVNNLVNYNVANNVAIDNVGTLAVNCESTFGNGTKIEVLNEGGGRDLPIFDKLTAQIAYLMVVYRHDKILIEKLSDIINSYINKKKSIFGNIGEHARILNTTSLRNVNVGSYTAIFGATNLENGTIKSSREAPTFIGKDVIAKDFIILSGSKVDNGAILTSSFVGQSVRIGKQFSAEGSAFFANCEGFHGEACSLFAGPYTVTHHKSTLMIAGMFSFFNAGSGTNQSNHMYKLGPLHQGTVERGSKTGAFSYMLWPCKVGAFTVVMDKHSSNFNTSNLPFSYINIERGKSVITPAMNLFTVGTARDGEKWPTRDKRQDTDKLDLIIFDVFNPFTVGKMIAGASLLTELHSNTSKNQEFVTHLGIYINRLMLRTSCRYYETAINAYLGNEVVKRLEQIKEIHSIEQLRLVLKPIESNTGSKWVDILGLISAESSISDLTNRVKSGDIDSIENLRIGFNAIFNQYKEESYA
jgi:carbonic anhydrase/acetyltransferase-like protein (isoleucine patch superfamily)